jgi:hypothetical protein
MDLHRHLRDLVTRQGSSVVDTAEVFRAALDDYLTEDEATTGELNLLVDAVRLGGVHRLVTLVENGADQAAAVHEADDAFARDRGTDDRARCRWAVAVVGYALGRVDEAVVRENEADSPGPSVVPTIPPPSPGTEALPRTFPETEVVASVPAPPPSAPPPRRRAGRTLLVALLVAVIVAGAVLAGIWLGNRDDPEQTADDPGGGNAEAPIPDNSIVLAIIDENGDSRIYAVDADSGEDEQLTDGPTDRLPVISPDRSTLIYIESAPGEAGRPIVMDMATRETWPLFGKNDTCDFAARPAFNPAGDRLAVVCLDEFGTYLSTAVVDLGGQYVASLPVSGEPMGTPTWTSGNTLVYTQAGSPETEPATLWETEVNGTSPPEQLTDGTEGSDSHPDWSDEAGLLLFSRHGVDTVFGDLLTGDADRNPGPFTDGELWAHPAWSPDGERVVVTVRDDEGVERLGVVRGEEDGFSDVEYVPDLPGEPGVPAWGSR